MVNGIRTCDPPELNKRRGSKFCVGSRVRQTPEEGRRIYRPKRFEYINKEEDNSPKTLNDKSIIPSQYNIIFNLEYNSSAYKNCT